MRNPVDGVGLGIGGGQRGGVVKGEEEPLEVVTRK